jgi:hypothetical protein
MSLKISALTLLTGLAVTDVLPVVRPSLGTAGSRKTTLSDLFAAATDGTFRISNTSDNTKKAAFSCSGITGTKTFTWPNASGTVALINGAAQTWSTDQIFSTKAIFGTDGYIRPYTAGDTDITALTAGTTAGLLFKAQSNGHLVIKIDANDDNDSFYILGVSGSNTSNDKAATTMAFRVQRTGAVTIGANLVVNNTSSTSITSLGGASLAATSTITVNSATTANLWTLQNSNSGGVARLAITNDRGTGGNVGVLDIVGSGSGTVIFGVTATDYTRLLCGGTNAAGFIIGCSLVDKPIIFGINTNEVARFTSGTLSTGALTVAYTTASTSITTGGLISAGGIGAAKCSYLANIGVGLSTKTANYTLTADDGTVRADATSATFTVTLPTAVGCSGRRHTITRIDGSGNLVTIATTSSQTMNGLAGYVLSVQYESITVQSNGANWEIIK